MIKLLTHDNIIPVYGVSTTVADFCQVSPWCENGNIMEYVKRKPGINRFDLGSTSGQASYS